MRTRLSWLCVSCAVVWGALLGVCPLVAQEPPAGQDASANAGASAKQRYRAGAAAFSEKHYSRAIELFMEADELQPSAALSYDIARAYEASGDGGNAAHWYRDYLQRAESAGDRARVMRRIAKLEKQATPALQQITVSTSPPGANIVIDEDFVGSSPWTGQLPVGIHSLKVTLERFADLDRKISLAADSALSLQFALAPLDPSGNVEPTAMVRRDAATLPPSAADEPPVPQQLAAPLAAKASTPARPASVVTTLGWVAVVAGAALLGGSLAFELLRRDAELQARKEPVQIRYQADLDTMASRQTAARVLAISGAGLAVSGVILWLAAPNAAQRERDTSVAVACMPSRCGLMAQVRF